MATSVSSRHSQKFELDGFQQKQIINWHSRVEHQCLMFKHFLFFFILNYHIFQTVKAFDLKEAIPRKKLLIFGYFPKVALTHAFTTCFGKKYFSWNCFPNSKTKI